MSLIEPLGFSTWGNHNHSIAPYAVHGSLLRLQDPRNNFHKFIVRNGIISPGHISLKQKKYLPLHIQQYRCEHCGSIKKVLL